MLFPALNMSPMTIALFILCCYSYTSTIQADDAMQMVERVMRRCKERYKIQASDIENAIKNRKLPQDEKGKGFLMCIIKEVGFNQLKKIIRGGSRLDGSTAGLIELPWFEEQLEEVSHMAIA